MPARLHVVARIVWASLLVAVGIYHVVLWQLSLGAETGNATMAGLMRPLLVSVAAALTLGAWLVHRRALESAAAPGAGPLDPARALSCYFVCWALAEGIAVAGLMLGAIGRAPAAAAPFLVWSVVVLVYLRPRAQILGA